MKFWRSRNVYFRCNKISQKSVDFTVLFFYCLLFMNICCLFQFLGQNVTVETKTYVICAKFLKIIDNLVAKLPFFGIKSYHFHYYLQKFISFTNKVFAHQKHHILVQMLHFWYVVERIFENSVFSG